MTLAKVLKPIFFLFIGPLLSLNAQGEESPLTAQAKISPYEVEVGQIAQVEVTLNLPKNYKAYEDQFKLRVLSPEQLKVNQPVIQPVVEIRFTKFKT